MSDLFLYIKIKNKKSFDEYYNFLCSNDAQQKLLTLHVPKQSSINEFSKMIELLIEFNEQN